MNCKIHPILYQFYLRLKDTLGAEIVHRSKRTSSMSIEVIFYSDEMLVATGRLNTLPEAEKWGYWSFADRKRRSAICSIRAIVCINSTSRPFIPRKDAR
jgi:hypothetical protein